MITRPKVHDAMSQEALVASKSDSYNELDLCWRCSKADCRGKHVFISSVLGIVLLRQTRLEKEVEMGVKKVGEKYRCNVCGNEVAVTRVGGGTLVCCGQEMEGIEG